MPLELKNSNQNESCGAKFSNGYDMEALDLLSLSKRNDKNDKNLTSVSKSAPTNLQSVSQHQYQQL